MLCLLGVVSKKSIFMSMWIMDDPLSSVRSNKRFIPRKTNVKQLLIALTQAQTPDVLSQNE